jgi:hypothetical protein
MHFQHFLDFTLALRDALPIFVQKAENAPALGESP